MSRDTTIHPHRLVVAAHEIGHYLIWSAIPGARVVRVRLTGRGAGSGGDVTMNWKRAATDTTANHDYLMGLLAGTEAQKLWCRRTGTRVSLHDGHDMAAFRKARRVHAPSRQWSENTLRSDARRVLTARWSEVERLAHRLAKHGRI